MKIEISNTIKVKEASLSITNKLVDRLTIVNPEYEEAVDKDRSTHGIPKYIYDFNYITGGIEIPRGYRKHLFNIIDGLKYTTVDNRKKFPRTDINSAEITYRYYQRQPVVDLMQEEDGLLVAPAGSGKTLIGLTLIPIFGQPTLWLTHTNRLAKQAIDRATEFLPDLEKTGIGFIGAGKWEVGNLFTVALVQTLIRRPEQLQDLLNKFGLVIVDEAHHCPAKTFTDVVKELNPYFLYGLTATPFRRDKLEKLMFQTLGDIRSIIEIDEVRKHGGIILPCVKYRTLNIKYPKKLRKSNNTQKIMSHIIEDSDRNNIIVGDVLREATLGNYCIVISDRKAHCEELYSLVSKGWDKTGIATGSYSEKYCDDQVKKFYESEITVLVTTFALLGEGFDVDFLNRAFVTTPFRAKGKAVQLVGRIQRSADGKKDAIVYDYVDDNVGVLRHQFEGSRFNRNCRYTAYEELGMNIEPYNS